MGVCRCILVPVPPGRGFSFGCHQPAKALWRDGLARRRLLQCRSFCSFKEAFPRSFPMRPGLFIAAGGVQSLRKECAHTHTVIVLVFIDDRREARTFVNRLGEDGSRRYGCSNCPSNFAAFPLIDRCPSHRRYSRKIAAMSPPCPPSG
jgi:hypothetical protein